MPKVIFTTSLFLIFSQISLAQKGTHSPYSVFGMGELNWTQYATYAAMGNVMMANSDSTAVNCMNPAMYSYLMRHKPVFQIGVNGRFSRFSTENALADKSTGSMGQFQLGIPIKKRWGMAMGIMPYSSRGYSIFNYVIDSTDTTHQFVNEGAGGITQVFLGLSWRPLDYTYNDTNFRKKRGYMADGKAILRLDTTVISRTHKLSFGLNGNYLFGSAIRKQAYEKINYEYGVLNSRVENSLRITDGSCDFGLNYQNFYSSDSSAGSFSLGLGYSPRTTLRAYQDINSYTYYGSFYIAGKPVVLKDTVEYVQDNQGTVLLPETYRAGIEYRFGPGKRSGSLLRLAADIKCQKWSAYFENFGTSHVYDTLKDRLSLGLGLEFTPSIHNSVRSNSTPFISRLRYRLGFHYTQTQWQSLNDLGNKVQIGDYGISFGLGIPVELNFSNSSINFGGTFGNTGTTAGGLIQERYFGFYFGLSLTPGRGNYWFIKQKYD